MKIQKFNIRGTEMNRIQFSEIADLLEEKGINVDQAFFTLVDENDSTESVYVSNGFVRGLSSSENELKEWHHFFKKDGSDFVAGKFQFA